MLIRPGLRTQLPSRFELPAPNSKPSAAVPFPVEASRRMPTAARWLANVGVTAAAVTLGALILLSPKDAPAARAVELGASLPRFESPLRGTAEKVFRVERQLPRTDPLRTVHEDFRDAGVETRSAEAQQALRTQRPGEAKVLESKDTGFRSTFRSVAKALESHPEARLALGLLLLEGKLEQKSISGRSLLTELFELQAARLASGVPKDQLLRQVVRELATPTAISQHGKYTCTVTSVQIRTASERPADYARIVRGLASESGCIGLPGGLELRRARNTESDDGSGRTVSARLFQSALMDAANGTTVYDNSADLHLTQSGGSKGLRPSQLAPFMNAVFGGQHVELENASVSRLAECLTRNQSVLGSMRWGTDDAASAGRHMVVFTGMSKGQVYFTNPWGSEDSIPARSLEHKGLTLLVDDPGSQGHEGYLAAGLAAGLAFRLARSARAR